MFPSSNSTSGLIGVRSSGSDCDPRLKGLRWFAETTGARIVQDKEKARLAEIIEKVNGLFEGDLTDDDQLVYVNNVIKGKLLES
jgi:hypothetical protein